MAPEDRRAHERINTVEETVKILARQHAHFEQALAENTAMTKEIAGDTKEIISFFKSVKGVRTFMMWVAGPVAIIVAAWSWVKGH